MAPPNRLAGHTWTEGSFRKSTGLGWVITSDNQGAGSVIDQGSKTLKGKRVAFGTKIIAIEEALNVETEVAPSYGQGTERAYVRVRENCEVDCCHS
jgi:hypothetical protein